jgi:hypothetical protein
MQMRTGSGVALAAMLAMVLCQPASAETMDETSVVEPARPAVIRLYELPLWQEARPYRPGSWPYRRYAPDRFSAPRRSPGYGYAWRYQRPDDRWRSRTYASRDRFDRYGDVPRYSSRDFAWRDAPRYARRDWRWDPHVEWTAGWRPYARTYGWRY